jgi:alpha-galactosidase
MMQLTCGLPPPPPLLLLLLLLFAASAAALDNGAAPLPPRGVTTWELFNFNVSDAAIRSLADEMVSTGLLAAGYDILWVDDGWPSCAAFSGAPGVSSCATPAPRGADGTIVPDATKFPSGISGVASYVHGLGLRLGIYSAPHAVTCGGYEGSLGNEALDAATFAAWGVDAVKMDAGCRDDCSLLDGCIISALERVRDGLNKTGRTILFYVDMGNPTAGPTVYNPLARGWPNSSLVQTHFARTWPLFAPNWYSSVANAVKIWFDRYDAWSSLMDNVHKQVNMAWFQGPGYFLHPDQMTLGQGRFSLAESRSEVLLYAVLAAPMFLSAAPAALSPELLALATNPEVLAVNHDADATMATLVASNPGDDVRGAGVDVWVKPMSDGSFVFVLTNRDALLPRTATAVFADGGDGGSSDLFPGGGGADVRADVRDLVARADLGTFSRSWSTTLAPHDSVMVRVRRV